MELLSKASFSSPVKGEEPFLLLSLSYLLTLLTTRLFCSTTTSEGDLVSSLRTLPRDEHELTPSVSHSSSLSIHPEPSTPLTTCRFTSLLGKSSSRTLCKSPSFFDARLSFADLFPFPSLYVLSILPGTATSRTLGLTLLFPSRSTPSIPIPELFERVSSCGSKAFFISSRSSSPPSTSPFPFSSRVLSRRQLWTRQRNLFLS